MVEEQVEENHKHSLMEPLLWETYIQGKQNLFPEKFSSHYLCICSLCWKDTSIQEK